MDLNLLVVSGRLAAPPEIRQYESGARVARYLITVRSDEPNRRVDVLPVTMWNPSDELIDAEPTPGTRVWVAGSIQRRFWSGSDGRRSRIELVADQVCLREEEAVPGNLIDNSVGQVADAMAGSGESDD